MNSIHCADLQAVAEPGDPLGRPRYHTFFQALPNSQMRMPAVHHPASKGKLQ